MYLLGDKKDIILSSFELNNIVKIVNNRLSANYKIAKTRFVEYVLVGKSVIYQQTVFNKQVQIPNEPLNEYILSFGSVIEHCRF